MAAFNSFPMATETDESGNINNVIILGSKAACKAFFSTTFKANLIGQMEKAMHLAAFASMTRSYSRQWPLNHLHHKQSYASERLQIELDLHQLGISPHQLGEASCTVEIGCARVPFPKLGNVRCLVLQSIPRSSLCTFTFILTSLVFCFCFR
ncbi:hypothetical protein Scep_002222 [Stephania cephalantha]|uniref:Uncharacterized protein n=1 Tax=Stephania cephalantha TaxID=152367 RepID=A0AAP0L9S0_9MAGN